MDETRIRFTGKWMHDDRAADRDGQTLDFMLSGPRDQPVAPRFFRRATCKNGFPDRIAIDKSGANPAALEAANVILKFVERA